MLNLGERLTAIDPEGEQVADLLAFHRDDIAEVISFGRTLDYASRLFLTTGDPICSNRSNVMLWIIKDTVGRHDIVLPLARRTRPGSFTATSISPFRPLSLHACTIEPDAVAAHRAPVPPGASPDQ